MNKPILYLVSYYRVDQLKCAINSVCKSHSHIVQLSGSSNDTVSENTRRDRYGS